MSDNDNDNDTASAQRGVRGAPTAIDPNDACALAHGIDAVVIEPGRAVLRMTVRADMLNPHGICHGGVSYLLADTAVAYASGFDVVTTSASVTYPNAARPGDVLSAECRLVYQASRAGIYDVTISDSTGVPVCLVRGHTLRIAGSSSTSSRRS